MEVRLTAAMAPRAMAKTFSVRDHSYSWVTIFTNGGQLLLSLPADTTHEQAAQLAAAINKAYGVPVKDQD